MGLRTDVTVRMHGLGVRFDATTVEIEREPGTWVARTEGTTLEGRADEPVLAVLDLVARVTGAKPRPKPEKKARKR